MSLHESSNSTVTSTNMDMTSNMLYQSAGMLLFMVIFLVMWSLGCKKNRLEHLQTPLLAGEDVDHRVDAANREAEAGFTVCPGCSFENFKRYSHCTLCGEALPVEGDENSESKSVSKDDIPMRLMKLTQRQIRARKRKEWARKLDVEGNVFWYRACTSQGIESQFPGFVAQYNVPVEATYEETVAPIAPAFTVVPPWPRSVPSSPSSSSSSASSDSDGDEDSRSIEIESQTNDRELASVPEHNDTEAEQSSTVNAMEAPAMVLTEQPTAAVPSAPEPEAEPADERPLLQWDSSISLELVEATKADPAVFATSERVQSTERMKEIIDFASNDFPTKYAHFVVKTASLLTPAEIEFLKLSVHRDYIMEESMDHLRCIQNKNIRSYMRINFLEESGVDAGGVHREWFMLLNELLVDPNLRLFECTSKVDQSYFLNPNSQHEIGEDHLTFYYSTGRLMGRALLEGGVWGFHLALPLLKIILGQPVSFSDLEYLDPEVYKSMLWILEHDGVDALGLDFSVTHKIGENEIVAVDLIPDGRNVDVTDANKLLYLERKFKYLVFESVESQLYMLLKGLYEVIPPEMLMLFDPEEFDYLLCGTQEIDVADWKAHTVNTLNMNKSNVERWFWEVVADMPNEYRSRLLLFATGSSRVPLSGFAGLTSYDGRLCPFTLKGVPYQNTQYICSHACFNRLDVPFYKTKKELQTMLYATLETDLYGFTTA